MTKLALLKIRNYIQEHNYPAYLVTQVHDEIGVEVREDKAEEWAGIQKTLMEEAGNYIIKNVYMSCDASITDKWSK